MIDLIDNNDYCEYIKDTVIAESRLLTLNSGILSLFIVYLIFIIGFEALIPKVFSRSNVSHKSQFHRHDSVSVKPSQS